MPLSLRIDVRTVPYAHFSITVCLRQQVLRELGTLNVCGCSAAGPLLATSIGGCSSANGALGRRPICPENPLGQARAPKFLRCAGRLGWRLSAQETSSRGRRAKTGGWRVQAVRAGALIQPYNTRALVSYLLCSQVASCGPMRARCMCVRCPCALHPLTNPFAGCMAGREGCLKVRAAFEEDGRAVAALPRRDSLCCRTHPQPSHRSRGGQCE